MIILGLDISTKSTGWAIFEDTKLVDYGCASASSTNVYDRIDKIVNELRAVVEEYHPTSVIAEEPEPAFVKNNIDVYRKLTFAHGAIGAMLNKHKLSMQLCSSSHWRKAVGIKTGRGITRAQLKPADIAKANELFDLNNKNDDIADAILIAYSFALEQGSFFGSK